MRKSLLGNAATGAGAPGSPAYKVLLEQLNASCEELEVRKEEVLILRSQLVSQKEAMHHKVALDILYFVHIQLEKNKHVFGMLSCFTRSHNCEGGWNAAFFYIHLLIFVCFHLCLRLLLLLVSR